MIDYVQYYVVHMHVQSYMPVYNGIHYTGYNDAKCLLLTLSKERYISISFCFAVTGHCSFIIIVEDLIVEIMLLKLSFIDVSALLHELIQWKHLNLVKLVIFTLELHPLCVTQAGLMHFDLLYVLSNMGHMIYTIHDTSFAVVSLQYRVCTTVQFTMLFVSSQYHSHHAWLRLQYRDKQ